MNIFPERERMPHTRRSKIHIYVDILKLVYRKGKAKPTHILYGANLSHQRLKRYLGLLVDNNFVDMINEGGRVYYRITPKGLEFVQQFRKVEEFSEAFGIPI